MRQFAVRIYVDVFMEPVSFYLDIRLVRMISRKEYIRYILCFVEFKSIVVRVRQLSVWNR